MTSDVILSLWVSQSLSRYEWASCSHTYFCHKYLAWTSWPKIGPLVTVQLVCKYCGKMSEWVSGAGQTWSQHMVHCALCSQKCRWLHWLEWWMNISDRVAVNMSVNIIGCGALIIGCALVWAGTNTVCCRAITMYKEVFSGDGGGDGDGCNRTGGSHSSGDGNGGDGVYSVSVYRGW